MVDKYVERVQVEIKFSDSSNNVRKTMEQKETKPKGVRAKSLTVHSESY